MCFILACPCSLHEVDKVVDEMADLVVDMKVDKVADDLTKMVVNMEVD